jgi:hypothetical protein
MRKKNRNPFLSRCGFFDHPDLQSLNDYIFFFLRFAIAISIFLGREIHCWEDIFKTFPTVYYKPQDS